MPEFLISTFVNGYIYFLWFFRQVIGWTLTNAGFAPATDQNYHVILKTVGTDSISAKDTKMKIYYVYTAILLIILLTLCSKLFAEAIILEEIIVRGEREVPQKECLEAKEIRETPARDVGEALKVIEGINSVRKGAIANDIVLRGFSRDNINVLIDGMRIYGACPNRMDPNSFHIDFGEIEKISVLKGPFDVKNPGSLGGLVEIKTTRPEKGWRGSVNVFTGSYKNINTSFNTSYSDDKVDALFGCAYRYSLPYKDGDGDRITELYSASSPNRYKDGEEDDKVYSINTFWSKFGFNLLANHRLEIGYARQEADDIIYPYLLMDAVYDDTDRLNVKYEISDISNCIKKLKAQFYCNQVKHDMTDERRVSSTGFTSGYMMRCYAEAKTFGGKLESDIAVYSGRLTSGIDYYFRNWDAENTSPAGTQKMMPDVDLNNIGAFCEYRRPLKKNLKLTIGARVDQSRSKANDDRSDLYNMYCGTRDRKETDSYAGGNIQLTYRMVENIELFAGLGHVTRPPGPDERYIAMKKPSSIPNWVGNPKLDPVKNREFDIGIKYNIGSRVYGKATFYYADIKDFITVCNITGPVKNARSFKNVDAALYGGEASFNLFLPFDLIFESGLSYTWGKDDTSDKPLSEISPLTGRISIRYDIEKYFIDVESIFADDQHRTDSDLNEEKTPGWAIVNFKAGTNYKNLNIFAGIDNIFDKQYVEHLSYQRDPFRTGIKVPEIGRSFYVSIVCKW